MTASQLWNRLRRPVILGVSGLVVLGSFAGAIFHHNGWLAATVVGALVIYDQGLR